MKIENQELIKLAILRLAHEITRISKTNDTAVKHIAQTGVRQKKTSQETQKNR